MSTHPSGYSGLQIGLHWAIGLLIVVNWFLGEGMGRALDARIESGAGALSGAPIHVWIGSLVFLLVLVRIGVRLTHGAPEPAGSGMMETAALWGHRLLYVLMVAVPAFGATAWYLKIDGAGEPHQILANALMVIAGLHAAFGIWHHYAYRDGTLLRMMRPGA